MVIQQTYCYFPNGDAKADGYACDLNNAAASPCCGNGWLCLDNGLCYEENDKILARGSCTDPSWTSPQCPHYCTESLYSIHESPWSSPTPPFPLPPSPAFFFLECCGNAGVLIWFLHIDEYKGADSRDFKANAAIVWNCSNNWPAEGGTLCCDILGNADQKYNGSCCSGKNAINRFSIGSGIGTATSLPPSSTAGSITSISTTSFPSNSASSRSSPNFSSSFSPSSQSSLSSSLSSSPTSSSAPTSNQSAIIGRTIAISVSTSVSAVVLIIAGFLIYQYLRRRRRESEQNDAMQTQDPAQTQDLLEVDGSNELSGHQEYELQTSIRSLTQELPDWLSSLPGRSGESGSEVIIGCCWIIWMPSWKTRTWRSKKKLGVNIKGAAVRLWLGL